MLRSVAWGYLWVNNWNFTIKNTVQCNTTREDLEVWRPNDVVEWGKKNTYFIFGRCRIQISANRPAVPRKQSFPADTAIVSQFRLSSDSLFSSRTIYWHYTVLTTYNINPLNAELNPICHLLALLGAHHILHVSRIRVDRIRNVLITQHSGPFRWRLYFLGYLRSLMTHIHKSPQHQISRKFVQWQMRCSFRTDERKWQSKRAFFANMRTRPKPQKKNILWLSDIKSGKTPLKCSLNINFIP